MDGPEGAESACLSGLDAYGFLETLLVIVPYRYGRVPDDNPAPVYGLDFSLLIIKDLCTLTNRSPGREASIDFMLIRFHPFFICSVKV